MLAWHVAHTRPQQEIRAAIELTKQDFHVFAPILETKPMFPRYIFVQFDRDIDPWGKIKSTRGCIDVLKNGYRPVRVHEGIIDAIMAYKPTEAPTQADPVFQLSQKVRITHGLLQGYEGLFEGTDKQRVQAFLNILGNKVSVPVKDIAPAA